ncbi:type I polyketide synthase [Hyalangium versicolor]|uniref:type I polyketide synthase n=1 Tax=Hyalangium versicolor TaxID=2861190 RepID=UPI001CC94F4C|nr:type I polyketide synthase [Hyalangium versicolor]
MSTAPTGSLPEANSPRETDIAIIGMACRFPGAMDVDAFWRNLREGVESITFFSEEELTRSGLPSELIRNPRYVRAAGILQNVEGFDAGLFGYSPREAELIDPQQRLFLECAWEALESAGCDPQRYPGTIGVYAGCGLNTYLLNNLATHEQLQASARAFQVLISNDKDLLPTRVSYKLNLRGPSVNVQTACSTSLVAIHVACQSILNGECDVALAGGASVRVPHKNGYLYEDGMTFSSDGHCRAFDSTASGTVGSNGVGVVVLKLLSQALADGDVVAAVIKGSAINNDGSSKAGFTAPGVNGQQAVIQEAHAVAGVPAGSITYVEAHGTGTSLGDPIELTALTRAFRGTTAERGFCRIGSLKTNVGHMDTAAGVGGVIKVSLALQHGLLPPTLNFIRPNPAIDFENSPFVVNDRLTPWHSQGGPRRAGVSSFGIGGTNAHLILEEAPARAPTPFSDTPQLLVLSAQTRTALESSATRLAQHLEAHPSLCLADVAHTLQNGRTELPHRLCVVATNPADAAQVLSGPGRGERLLSGFSAARDRPVAFLFSGGGAQAVNMGAELRRREPVFQEHVERCCELLRSRSGLDLEAVLYSAPERQDEAAIALGKTRYALPALFVTEYALAQLWMSWGITPSAMLGHSIGEYVAACLAGVFSLEDALEIVAARGALIQGLPRGANLSVPLSEQEVRARLTDGLSLAAVNAPSLCVISGLPEDVNALHHQLTAEGIESRFLRIEHAAHSRVMDAILAPFRERFTGVKLHAPTLPFLSNVTGTWITAGEATDPGYWVKQLRQPVRFSDGIAQLLKDPEQLLLEIGPGRTLTTLARMQPETGSRTILPSLNRQQDAASSEQAHLLGTLGRLWLAGRSPDWSGVHAHSRRNKIRLPTYPFERSRHWIDSQPPRAASSAAQAPALMRKPELADWIYLPSWRRTVPFLARSTALPQVRCLLMMDECGLGTELQARLEAAGVPPIVVRMGAHYHRAGLRDFTLAPGEPEHYQRLLETLRREDQLPEAVLHLWNVTPEVFPSRLLEDVEPTLDRGLHSLVFLAQAIGRSGFTHAWRLLVVANQLAEVLGDEELHPVKSALLGACKVIPQEYTGLWIRCVDVVLPPPSRSGELAEPLLQELSQPEGGVLVAYRGRHRFEQFTRPFRMEVPTESTARLKEGGVYLLAGGLGGIGLALAGHLARTVRARLLLTGRGPFPAREQWDTWLAEHEARDATSQRIHQLREMERQGAQVWIEQADVADLERMRTVVREALRRFGRIDGVIQAAGVLDEGGLLQGRTRASLRPYLSARVHGTLVLQRVLEGQPLDFFLLCSTLGTELHQTKFGQVAHCAASDFLDAFAPFFTRLGGTPTVSVGWFDWKGTGMYQQATERWAQRGGSAGPSVFQDGVSPSEGARLFGALLRHPFSRVLVSPFDLEALGREGMLDARARLEASAPQAPPRQAHQRPELGTPYVAPEGELENKLASLWEHFLGIQGIGVQDNLMDLGLHSLLATQAISKLRSVLQLELPLSVLFEYPTIAGQAACIQTLMRSRAAPAIPPGALAPEREVIEL